MNQAFKMIKKWYSLIINFLKGDPKKLITNKPNLIVGENTLYNGNIAISGTGIIKIGKYCAIGPNLSIISSNHNYNLPCLQKTLYQENFNEHPKDIIKGETIIGNDVWFGQNVVVLSGVKIGNGACIGAGSVVVKDIPDYAIAAGVPAKVIRYRFNKDIIKFLKELKWWNWSQEQIKKNREFFMTDLNTKSIKEIKNIIK
mgnify:CR=1 FL=1